jgi:hypothetical protein
MANVANKSFASGELAPALYARTDLAKYAVGLRTCRNMMVMRQGGVTKRPGTEYLGAVKDNTKKVRLIPFIFNVRDSFVLEFGEHYVRFKQNGGTVVDPINPANAYEITNPYLETDLPDLQYVQSGDVVTLVHPNYPPQELKRFGNQNWTLTPIVFGAGIAAPGQPVLSGGLVPAGPPTNFSTYQITSVTLTGEESIASVANTLPRAATAKFPIAISWTAVTGADSYNVYKRVPDTGMDGIYAFIGTTRTTGFQDVGDIPDITQQPPIDPGLFAAINDYPSVVGYYQQRLVFANSNNHPDTFWCSRTGFFHNFNISVIVQDDDAITARPVSDAVDEIRHILNLGRLIIGTEGVDWIVDGDGNGVLTPTAVNMRAASYDGMSSLKPIKAGSRMLFVQALGAAVRELQSNVQFGYYSLVGGDVTLYSSHLVDGFKLVDWAFQQEPPKIVWAVRSDGVLLGLTYIPEQEVLAWHRHDTKGFIENVCVVPEGKSHWVYWVVKRLINGTYRRYIERQTTSTVLPVFATPEEGAAGPIVTPPPPPPPPPPSTTPLPAPTNASTTAILATSATANWIFGSALAVTDVEYRAIGATDWIILSSVSSGVQSKIITGLIAGTAYEWRARHQLGLVFSDYLGPAPETRFTTATVVPTRDPPVSAPVVTVQTPNSGSTDLTITWPASSETTVRTDLPISRLQIAGPTAISPTDGEFSDVGTFVITSAVFRVTVTGTYWLRVRYEFPDDTISAWSAVSSWAITVT